MNRPSIVFLTVLISSLTSSCSSSKDSNAESASLSPFSPTVTRIVVEVDYATGAAPYTGDVGARGNVWGLFEANAKRLFQNGNKTIEFPKELTQMEEVKDAGTGDYPSERVLALADKHRNTKSAGNTHAYYVIWLDGYFSKDGQTQKDVLGVSIGSTGVIAMFKPVIESTKPAVGGQFVERYVEQSTLVHEFGHAVGLVNNGITMTAAHQDTEHGAHCQNTNCVMYWSNEGAAAAVDFVKRVIKEDTSVVFADECLKDVDSWAKSAK